MDSKHEHIGDQLTAAAAGAVQARNHSCKLHLRWVQQTKRRAAWRKTVSAWGSSNCCMLSARHERTAQQGMQHVPDVVTKTER
jgi:hypothetical protein